MTERVVALVLLIASAAYLASSWPLPRGTAARPGPGFFPLAVGAFACAVALVWSTLSLRRPSARARSAAVIKQEPGDGGRPPSNYRARVAVSAGGLVGFCLLLPWAGYTLVAFLFVTILVQRLGARWMPALAIGLVSAASSYYLFAVLLGVPLPRGVWFD